MKKAGINGDRLWDSLMVHGQIGGLQNGGVCREALTAADALGRDTFVQWCKAAGLDIAFDALGTIYATRPGTDNTLDPVAMGSHLDTQPSGGKFDGILGVLGALEVIRTLNDMNIQTRRPLTIINWTNEEGSRFPPSMIASGVYAKKFSMHDVAKVADYDGIMFMDALNEIGYAGKEQVGERQFSSYLELHIEQGPILEREDVDIGVVTGAQAMSWNRLQVKGQEAHAGSTPMSLRHDAMAAATRIITMCFDQANEVDGARATIGVIEAKPASHNTIPHTVEFTVDMRHPDDEILKLHLMNLESAMERERKKGFMVNREQFGSTAATQFDINCVDTVRQAAAEAGFTHRDIVSGAGHDAVYISDVLPTAMIFVPCEGGISHNPIENITPAQARAGVEVLLESALSLAR